MKPIHVIAVGPLGEAIAAHLADEYPGTIISRPDSFGKVYPAAWPVARLHVLVAWRPVPAIATELDNAAFAWKVPWLSIIAEHPYLRIGPAVIPGVGPCHTCFRQRYLQHSTTADLTESLAAFYDHNPAAGPGGYLPSVVTLGTMVAREVIDATSASPEAEAGQIRQINLLNLRTLKCGVVGIHNCSRCGSQRDERSRSYSDLAAELESIRLIPSGR